MSTVSIRNFRIDDATWLPAREVAQNLGISLTVVVKSALRAFARDQQVTIGEPEEVKMPSKFYRQADQLGKAIGKIVIK